MKSFDKLEGRPFLLIYKFMNKCPFCKNVKPNKHLIFCKDNNLSLSKIELRKMYLEYNYPDIGLYKNLNKVYNIECRSLKFINEKYGIDYNSIKFLLNYYNMSIRGHSEAAILSMPSRIKTNIQRYGSVNVLSKNTSIYVKKTKTVRDKYGVDNVFQIDEVKSRINDDAYYMSKYGMTLSQFRSNNAFKFWNSVDKVEFVRMCNNLRFITYINKYGDHPSRNNNIREKLVTTNRIKYDKDYIFQTDEFINSKIIKSKIKSTKVKNGQMVSDLDLEPFYMYKRNCVKLTKRNKKFLFSNWDGYDYYDGEFIKDNLSLHNTNPIYPTIDHKISVFYGFINNIDEDIICSIDNLCITKRSINSSKRHKTNLEYEKLS